MFSLYISIWQFSGCSYHIQLVQPPYFSNFPTILRSHMCHNFPTISGHLFKDSHICFQTIQIVNHFSQRFSQHVPGISSLSSQFSHRFVQHVFPFPQEFFHMFTQFYQHFPTIFPPFSYLFPSPPLRPVAGGARPRGRRRRGRGGGRLRRAAGLGALRHRGGHVTHDAKPKKLVIGIRLCNIYGIYGRFMGNNMG